MRKECWNCKNNGTKDCDNCYASSSNPTPSNWKADGNFVPDTNADHTRAMSGEELLISADALKKQIAKVKKCFTSENSAYKTGYISALSVVEGMIAYLEAPLDESGKDADACERKDDAQ